MLDGVIKYYFTCLSKKALSDSLFFEIEEVRKRLFKLGLIGVKNGVGYGNISQRTNKNSFVITGTQTGHLSDLKPSHYSLVDSLDFDNFNITYSGSIQPSSEAMTHGSIYQLDDRIGAVIHIHSLIMWNFMLDHSFLKTKNVAYGSKEMTNEVKRIYKNQNPLENSKFVMSGHKEGIIIFGENIKEAESVLMEMINKLKNES